MKVKKILNCIFNTTKYQSGDRRQLWGAEYLDAQRTSFKEKYEEVATEREYWIHKNQYYYDYLKQLLLFLVRPNKRVLQIRCDTGDLLDAVSPSYGLGIDVSPTLVSMAQEKYPNLRFEVGDPEELQINDTFDYVLLVNAIGDIIDIEKAFMELQKVVAPHTRIVIISYNYLWEPIVALAQALRLKRSQPPQNWLSLADIGNLLYLTGFEVVREYRTLLFPKYIPGLSTLLNKFIGHLPIIERLNFVQVLVARQAPHSSNISDCSVSVIIPCKNEKGNIEDAVKRIPDMGKHTEIIFVDDKSLDGTGNEVRRWIKALPDRDIKCVEGPGICKGYAVWKGFAAASRDILIILDGDLTVMPEELPYFYKAIVEGKGEFINGSRLVYPQQEQAMKFLNILGNKLFSMAFSYLLGQRIKDTLCGTKALWRKDYERLKPFIDTWGVTDRWGDYELFFGAARLGLKIVDCPVHYLERMHGETKMTKRFSNAWNMLRMCIAAMKKLKFL